MDDRQVLQLVQMIVKRETEALNKEVAGLKREIEALKKRERERGNAGGGSF
jgi:hypothetical protein